MSIKCGNHGTEKVYHDSIDAVRRCFAGATVETPKYGDVYLSDSEQAKISAGIREMESEGILPRRGAAQPASPRERRTPTAPSGYRSQTPEVQISPKGREIHEDFGGSPKQFDFIFSLLEELGALDGYDWSKIFSVRKASMELDTLQDRVRNARSAKVRQDFHEIHSDGAAYDAKDAERMQARTAAVFAPSSNAPDLATTDGIFRNPQTGEIFKGQFNRAQGDGRRLYFKRLVLEKLDGSETRGIPLTETGKATTEGHLSWEYAGGAQRAGVKAEWLMSREDAEAFGALYGVCVRCHRDLTREESIERAMGPVCAGKQGW